MDVVQINVKLYLEDEGAVDPVDAIPVFHDWIKHHRLDEVLVDVADYSHVHDGPGVLLVGHEAHYGLDQLDGRTGLSYSRKRGPAHADLEATVVAALRRVLVAAKQLEAEPELGGKVRFRGNEVTLAIPDRLRATNDDATLVAVRPALEKVLGRVYAGESFAIERTGGEREPFTVKVTSDASPNVATMLDRLAA